MSEKNTKLRDRLEALVGEMCEKLGPRPPGSQAERRAAEWVAQRLAEQGYEPQLEEFECPAHGADGAVLTGLDKDADMDIYPTQHSPTGRVTGPLHWLGFGEEHLRQDVAGRIGVLMATGDRHELHRLLERLEAAGMLAVIAVGPYGDTITGKAVRPGSLQQMLTTTVSIRTALELSRYFGREVTLEVTGSRPTAEGRSQNVVAELPGAGPNVLVVCAHYDTAPHSPGALDNASGTALMLELARSLRGQRFPATVLFVATGAGEFGADDGCGQGAKALFARRLEELPRVIGCFAIDAVGCRLGVRHLRLWGPKPFRSAVPEFAGVARDERPPGGCGDGSAHHCGLATVALMDDYASNPFLHGPGDTPEILDFEAMAGMLKVCQRIVTALAATDPPYRYRRRGELLIRPARWEDIPAMGEITREAFGPYSMSRMKEDFFGAPLGGKPWHHYKVRSVCDHARRAIDSFIVAEWAGRVVGYASYSLDEEQRLAEVGNNAVLPDYQRRGIATALQEEIMARFAEEGYQHWTVATLSNDLPAQRLYAKMGFEEYIRSIMYLRK